MDTYLSVSAQPLGIPYYRDASETGSASYVDLKAEPHRIAEIPEVTQWPCIKRLLVRLNAPQSQLMSLGCGVFVYPPELPQKPVWTAFAYVGYCFADLTKNEDARAYFPQFFHFNQHYRAKTNTNANVFFELRETGFYDERRKGFSLDYIVRPWAQTQAELEQHIEAHLNDLHDFLPLMGLVPLL